MSGKVARPEHCSTMSELREAIDAVDRELVLMIAARQQYIERAAIIKQSRATVRDEARIEDVVNKVLHASDLAGLSRSIAEPVWRLMIEKSIEHEFAAFDRK